MKFIQFTELRGAAVYVGLDRIVSIEDYPGSPNGFYPGIAHRIITFEHTGGTSQFLVRDSLEEIIKRLMRCTDNA